MTEVKLTRRLDLERMIDQDGLSTTLREIVEICHLKSDHLETNWQDQHLAKQWATAANLLQTVINKFPLD